MNDMTLMVIEAAISVMLVVGGLFGLLGSFALIKLRDPMQRLHGPTKATTLGIGTALVASSLDLLFVGAPITWQEILIAVSLLVTAPLATLYMAKAHLFLTIDRAALPPTGTASNWATLDLPENDKAEA
jgi:multicomponent K+:H+ antiporter subunit G